MTFMVDDAFERVKVFANKFVVVRALAEYKLDRKRVERFATEMTFRVPTFAVVAKRLVVKEFKFEIVKTFRVPTFAVVDAIEFRFEIPETFMVSIEAP